MEFLTQAFAIFVMLAILGILIVVHETGHFLVARFFGFQTPVYGIGLPFGPYIKLGQAWETEFRIYAFLLGGFVLIPELGDESQLGTTMPEEEGGEEDEGSEVPDYAGAQDGEPISRKENQEPGPIMAFGVELKPFRKFPIWQRALVAVAGVTFNVLFAYLIMIFMLLSMGDPTYKTAVHGLTKSNPIARQAGVKKGDLIVGIDDVQVATLKDTIRYLQSKKSTPVTLHVLRDEKPVDINVTPNEAGQVGMVLITMGPVKYAEVNCSFPELLVLAYHRVYDLTADMMNALGQMVGAIFKNAFAGGAKKAGGAEVGIGDVHGVLAVIKIGADIAKQDWSQLFLFTILISMDLAIINLVPWPALDGGHLAFMTIEAIRGKPMGERAQGEIVRWGFISLLVLMAIIMVNDVTALVTGKLDFNKKQKQEQKKDDGKKSETGAAPETGKDAVGSGATSDTGEDAAGSGAKPETGEPAAGSGATPETGEPAAGSGATPETGEPDSTRASER